MTFLAGLEVPHVPDAAPERAELAAEPVIRKVGCDPLQAVRAGSAEILPAYANAARNHFPNAALVHDRYHLAKNLGEAVHGNHQAENKALRVEDDDRGKATRQIWLFSDTRLSWQRRRRFEATSQDGLKTARAWSIKVDFRWRWQYLCSRSAEQFFDEWYAWGVRWLLRPIVRVAEMLELPRPKLMSYFVHCMTGATSEGFNSIIQAVNFAARGFLFIKNNRTGILL